MPSTVQLYRQTGTGGSPTFTNIGGTNNRLNAADNPADGTTDPITIPASGSNYSFWASFRVCCTVPPSTLITAVQFWTSGTNPLGTGVDLVVAPGTATNGSATAGYTQATGTTGTTGNQLTTGSYPALTTSPVSAFGFTSGAPLSIPGTFTTGTDSPGTPATGYFADWIVLQVTVASTASPGVTPQAGYTIGWTES